MKISDFQKLIPQIKKNIEMQVTLALSKVAENIANDAQAMIGHEQPGWAPLAEATIKREQDKGQETPTPLLATGKLQKSIKWEVEGHHAVIGTDDPVAVDQEMGTETTPPRPFLSKSAIHNIETAERAFQAALIKAFKPAE